MPRLLFSNPSSESAGTTLPFLCYCDDRKRLSSNGNLNLNPGLDIDDDLLDHLGRRVQID